MTDHIALLSLKENKLFPFSNSFNGVSFKKMEDNKFLVCEDIKKSVVNLNDIFSVHENLYAFILKDNAVNILEFDKKHKDFFFLVNDYFPSVLKMFFNKKSIITFLHHLKFIFLKKNIIYASIILIFIPTIFSPTKTTKIENMRLDKLIERQKFIYSNYKYILKNLHEEMENNFFPEQKKENLDIKKDLSQKMTQNDLLKNTTSYKNKKKHLKTKKNSHKITDPDIKYFLNMKR